MNREHSEQADGRGPVALRAGRSARARARITALLLLLGCGAVLGAAAWLTPDPRGYGTHEQFGGGPCGMLVMTGLPCPTCGMTTAFAYAIRGQWVRAAWSQPAGFLLALATAGVAVVSAWALWRGRWPVSVRRLEPYALFVLLLVLLIGGWAAKIALGLLDGSLPYR